MNLKIDSGFKPYLSLAVVAMTHSVHGQSNCATNASGPTICALRFDISNGDALANPEVDVHFMVNYSGDPSNPDVTLLLGDVRFQLWSHVAGQPTTPANIGDITVSQTTAYDYDLHLRNPSGAAGAANVGSIVLTPPGTQRTRIIGESVISGTLDGALTLEAGGSLDAYAGITIGTLDGAITVPGMGDITITSGITSEAASQSTA